ncbi:MAG: hypothetical protein IVW57_11120 [Ktedonobacterales bacterium]|nr:hypothetical protein [Ktedonobacterales bacterium]
MNPRPWRTMLLVMAMLAVTALAACARETTAATTIPTATTGGIRLATDRDTYSLSQPIGVAVTNVSSVNLYAVTGLSACTFLQMQLYDAGLKQWRNVNGCVEDTAPQVLLIRSGMTEPFSLAPGTAPNANSWNPGIYRIALTFSSRADGKTSAQTAYSRGFTIKQ